MKRELLEAYQSNQRLIKRNREKIEQERAKEIPAIKSKVIGSSAEFPYIQRRFSTDIYEPVEYDKSCKRIKQLQEEIERAQTEMKQAEQLIANIEDIRIREIFTYRYIDGKKQSEIAEKVGYSKGRISQFICKYLKD